MKRGVTMLEMLVVLAIVALLGALGVLALSRFQSTAGLVSGQEIIRSTLREARSLTLSSQGATTYGVYFGTSTVVRFTGSSYATGTPSNAVYFLNSSVNISAINFSGGGSSVVFARLTGEASKTGTVVVSVINDATRRATSTITQSGIIE